MVDEIDIWRTASLFIDQHQDRAAIFAAMRADELLEDGVLEGSAVWLRVIKAIEQLLKQQPDDATH